MRRMLLTLVLAAFLLSMMAAPAFAYIHTTIPGDNCAAGGQPGENPKAGENIESKNPSQDPPVGNVTNAPTECPAPQK